MAPTLIFSEQLHAEKYRQAGETFRGACNRIADSLKDSTEHYHAFRETLLDGRFSPPGRVWSAMGAARSVTPYNCFVSRTIDDSMVGIMEAVAEAAQTLRLGGGIGYDFSTLRPNDDLIVSLQSKASGPVSFMDIFNATCNCIAAAGHRRGAQMGVMRCDHPDILQFIRAKRNDRALTTFNISVGITNEFMMALEADADFDLCFQGRKYSTVKASYLWAEIMRSTWDYAEPGVLFIDTINDMNNLWYCEKIAATNPCGEQPLPPYGACLLGSFNLAAYIYRNGNKNEFDYAQFIEDIPHVIRAMDNVVDRAIYPLEQQMKEAKAKRRMGIGVMGAANAIEALGALYGSERFVQHLEGILITLRNESYKASIKLAEEKEAFPLYDKKYLDSKFVDTLPSYIKEGISKHGIRNSHLLSIAPTGTISTVADGVSGGIEPVFEHEYERKVNMTEGQITVKMQDYGLARFGVRGKTSSQCSVDEHMNVLLASQALVDSAVSKTCNVGPDVSWDQFQDVYIRAWKGGAKGCTTFRSNGKREGILKAIDSNEDKSCDISDKECKACQE